MGGGYGSVKKRKSRRFVCVNLPQVKFNYTPRINKNKRDNANKVARSGRAMVGNNLSHRVPNATGCRPKDQISHRLIASIELR